MILELNSLFYLRFLSGLLALGLILVLWYKKKADGVDYLIWFELATAVWAITDGFEHAALTLEGKILWSQIGYIGSTTATVFFLLFTVSYVQVFRRIRKTATATLFLIPLITIILVFTNNHHHLIWKNVEYFPGTNESVYRYGMWFWVYAFYEYALLITSISILLYSSYTLFKIYAIQLVFLIIACILPLIASIIYVLKLIPLKADLTPVTLIVSSFLLMLDLYFNRMFEIVPVAKTQVISKLEDGVLIVDIANRIIAVNNALTRITGIPENELIDNHIDKIAKFFNDKQNYTANFEFVSEAKIQTDSGSNFYEIRCNPIKDNKNRIIGKIYLLHDITIRRKALDSVIKSNKLLKAEIEEKEKLIADLDAYARSVAHDLKNPLSGLIGLSEIIKVDIHDQNLEEAFELLDLIHEQSYKMVEIVDELLMLSRIRKEDIVPVEIDMQLIIKKAIARLTTMLNKNNAIVNAPEEWPLVIGQTQWIEEVWVNLMSNAIKYGGDPPEITLGYDKTNTGFIRFWIQDNGIGLNPSEVGKLFIDFERLGHKNIEGHGLGLSIVKRIVEKLGGEVSVTSENISGNGSVFSFTLRLA